uniref:Uncharacterized protein n=1 Tax=Setaria digitata TaxID=48799 RepID=A0A915PE22_9BILA
MPYEDICYVQSTKPGSVDVTESTGTGGTVKPTQQDFTQANNKSLANRKADLIKANTDMETRYPIGKTREIIPQEEPLPEIKQGPMEIAPKDDPKYKTLYFLMNKEGEIFGPDKQKPGQPEIGTLKKVCDNELAAKIEEIKARYGIVTRPINKQENEISWDALFVCFIYLFRHFCAF